MSGRPKGAAPLSFDELRKVNVARCEGVFHPVAAWSLTDWMTAVAGEVGEAANEVKKHRRGDDLLVRGASGPAEDDFVDPSRRERIAKELADVVCYLDLFAARLGVDLGEAVRAKFDEVSIRKHCLLEYNLGSQAAVDAQHALCRPAASADDGTASRARDFRTPASAEVVAAGIEWQKANMEPACNCFEPASSADADCPEHGGKQEGEPTPASQQDGAAAPAPLVDTLLR